MAASSPAAPPDGVCLILNLGTQEPRLEVNGRFLRLGQEVPEPEAQAVDDILQLGGRRGLWFAAQQVYRRWTPERDFCQRLRFPIALPAIQYALADSGAVQLDLLLLIATNVSTRPGTYEVRNASNDDTIFAARLLEKFIAASEWMARVSQIQIVEVVDRPHLYSAADRQIGQNEHFRRLGRFARIYVSQSPGLPMVNQAVLRHALRAARERVVPFQIEEPDDPEALLRGGLSERVAPVPTVDLLYDAAYEVLDELLNRYDYHGAIELVRRLPQRDDRDRVLPLLEKAHAIRRWDSRDSRTGVSVQDSSPLKETVYQLWMMSYTFDALVKKGDFTELLWRLYELLSQLRACAASLLCQFPPLITETWLDRDCIRRQCNMLYASLPRRDTRTGYSVNYLAGIAIKAARRRRGQHWRRWSEFVGAIGRVINFLEKTRNEIIHRARFFDRNAFDQLSERQQLLRQPGEWVRGRLTEFCRLARLTCPAPLPSFDNLNQEIRRAAGLL
jgi:hypothetical protein